MGGREGEREEGRKRGSMGEREGGKQLLMKTVV